MTKTKMSNLTFAATKMVIDNLDFNVVYGIIGSLAPGLITEKFKGEEEKLFWRVVIYSINMLLNNDKNMSAAAFSELNNIKDHYNFISGLL